MLLSSSNRKYPPLPLLSYFSVVVCLRCLLHLILSRIAYAFRENWEFVYIIIVHFRMSANSRIRFGLRILFVCLDSTPSYYHHCANLSVSEDIELIKRLSDIFLSIVWLRYSIFSQLSIIQYTGLCAFSLPIKPCDVWEYIYMLCLIIIIKSEVWVFTHCLGLGRETMLHAVCLSIFLQLIAFAT